MSLAEYFKNLSSPPDAVFSSPLSRAAISARSIAAVLGLEVIEVPDFRECDFGIWEGMNAREILRMSPGAFQAWENDPAGFRPGGGESIIDVRNRAIPALEKIVSDPLISSTVLVAHGGVNRIILSFLAGLPVEKMFLIEQNYACINIIRFFGDEPVIELINGTI